MPLVSRTRAILRRAEFGFFGVIVATFTHTPRFCEQAFKAGDLVLCLLFSRPNRTSWFNVGKKLLPFAIKIKKAKTVSPPLPHEYSGQNLRRTPKGESSHKALLAHHFVGNNDPKSLKKEDIFYQLR
jgi:hypothetical protein